MLLGGRYPRRIETWNELDLVTFTAIQDLWRAVDDINRVTREDVQRVARKYFNARNRTVAILVPEQPAEKPTGKEQP